MPDFCFAFARHPETGNVVDGPAVPFLKFFGIPGKESSDHNCHSPLMIRINRQKEVSDMMLWTFQEPKASGHPNAPGVTGLENPLTLIKTFIPQCRTHGMTYQETIAAVEKKFNYFPTEAEIVVRDFWK